MYNIKSKTLDNDVLQDTKEDFNLNCRLNNQDNANKDYDSSFFEKKSLLDLHIKNVNSKKIPKNIYSSNTLIPFNYKDNLDNNILYNLNVKKKDSVLKNEKKYYGKIQPFNQRILTSNFNYNLNNYDEAEYYTYMMKHCKNYDEYREEVCSLKDFKIRLFGKYNKNKLNLYWNLPIKCLDIQYLLLFYKDTTSKDYELIDLDYIKESTTKKYKNVGKMDAYYNSNRINYNFYFKYDGSYEAFIYIRFFGGKEIISNIYEEKN